MPHYQVTTRELVYVDRTYEVEAADIDAAKVVAKNRDGAMVSEDMQDTHSFERVIRVTDMHGNDL